MLGPIMVIDGKAVGTWRRVTARTKVAVTLSPWRVLSARDRGDLAKAAARYGVFVGKPVELV